MIRVYAATFRYFRNSNVSDEGLKVVEISTNPANLAHELAVEAKKSGDQRLFGKVPDNLAHVYERDCNNTNE